MSLEYYRNLITSRFRDVNKVLMICSGKGGVGKTFVSTCLSQALRDRGLSVGLLDLDIHGFTTHRLLGLRNPPKILEEEHPVMVKGLFYLSPVVLVEERALPLRGLYKEKAVIDLLACVKWPRLDYLVIDMPPGFGDEVTIPMRYLRHKSCAVIVATRDALSLSVVSRLIEVLRSEKLRVAGVSFCFSNIFKRDLAVDVDVVGEIPLIECVERALSEGDSPYERCIEVREVFSKLAERIIHRAEC